MPLIYLDTSDFVHLDVARKSNFVAYQEFVSAWRNAGCVSAFSQTHLLELFQTDSDAVRRQRIEVVADLIPIQTDIPLRGVEIDGGRVVREIVRSLVRRGLNPHAVPRDLLNPFSLLPRKLDSSEALRRHLQPYLAESFQTSVQHGRKLNQRSSAALSREPGQRWIPMTPRSFSKRHSDFRDKLMDSGISPDEQRHMLIAIVDAQLRSAGGAGEIASRFFQIGEDARPGLVQSITLRDTPGEWLVRHTEVERRKRVDQLASSTAYDLDHLGYAPEVDVLIGDGLTEQCAHAALARTDLPIALKNVLIRRLPAEVQKKVDWLRRL